MKKKNDSRSKSASIYGSTQPNFSAKAEIAWLRKQNEELLKLLKHLEKEQGRVDELIKEWEKAAEIHTRLREEYRRHHEEISRMRTKLIGKSISLLEIKD